jgi:hypothetical protein
VFRPRLDRDVFRYLESEDKLRGSSVEQLCPVLLSWELKERQITADCRECLGVFGQAVFLELDFGEFRSRNLLEDFENISEWQLAIVCRATLRSPPTDQQVAKAVMRTKKSYGLRFKQSEHRLQDVATPLAIQIERGNLPRHSEPHDQTNRNQGPKLPPPGRSANTRKIHMIHALIIYVSDLSLF